MESSKEGFVIRVVLLQQVKNPFYHYDIFYYFRLAFWKKNLTRRRSSEFVSLKRRQMLEDTSCLGRAMNPWPLTNSFLCRSLR